MGTIVKRKNPSGAIVYRAQIKIDRAGYPPYSESRTFSKHALAAAWLKKREGEIESNPDLLFEPNKTKILLPTLAEAVERWKDENQAATYSYSKASVLTLVGKGSLGQKRIDRLKRSDFAAYAMERQRGIPQLNMKPVKPSTIEGDLQYVRSLLKHAHFVWGMESVSWSELDMAMEGLRRSRVISKGDERSRLATSDELQRLTTFFYQSWLSHTEVRKIPMHLVMWFAIYSARREGEIARLQWSDYNEKYQEWLVRDVKNPRGSKGNHMIFKVRDELLPVIAAIRSPKVQLAFKMQGGQDDFVFGGHFASASIAAAWRNAYRVLGIDDLRFHDLRHEAATRLAEDGLSVPFIQQVTLHKDWTVLQRYVNMGARVRDNRLDFEQAMAVARREWEND